MFWFLSQSSFKNEIYLWSQPYVLWDLLLCHREIIQIPEGSADRWLWVCLAASESLTRSSKAFLASGVAPHA